MRTLDDVNQRHESSQRAKAFIADAVSRALFPQEPDAQLKHVERVVGRTHALLLQKTTVDAATTFGPDWAQPLGERRLYSQAFLELVRPRTVVDRLLGTLRAPMNVNVPVQDAPDVIFDWVGEGLPIPVGKLAIDAASLPPSKVAGVMVFSRELARHSNAQTIIERRLVDATAQGTDRAFLDPTRAAVANVSPASITNGATEINSTGTSASAMEADIADLIEALSDGSPAAPYIVVSPSVALFLATLRTANGDARVFPNVGLKGGDIMGVPVLVSAQAGSFLIGLDAAGIVIAETGVDISMSTQATVQMSDEPTNGANPGVSMFQAHAIALMVERWITWARRDDAAAYIDLPLGSPS